MARFFVGQRVRIVRVGDWAQLLGSEHRVVSVGQKAWSSPFGWYVGYGLDGMTPGGSQIVAPDFCIEPILPEGHKPAELTVEELLPFLKAREVSDVAV